MSFLTAFDPSWIIGTLTMTFVPYPLIIHASLIIFLPSVVMTSKLTGPSTILVISFMIPSGLPCSFERRVGFVVNHALLHNYENR
ncbi:MAG: hypothetical protein MRJ93_03435 [Nitrososphaeraceae archaeon]|nr:hypothetical protein [Nitrososphaeraceae archaeon]